MCNISVVQADSNAPTVCKLSINNNASYTNNRYVTIDLYATDADPMQVWISNDGDTGTVIDFSYGKTITITDQNYFIGTSITSANSTTSTNSDNVLRIVNWPLSLVNGTQRIYAVFRDSYGNRTSVSGLTTIDVSFDLNGVSGNTPSTITTVKNLGVYLPNLTAVTSGKAFGGWSTSSSATTPNYASNSLASFTANTTLYPVYKTIQVGDFLYYPIDFSREVLTLGSSSTGAASQSFDNSSFFSDTIPVFQVLEVNDSNIVVCPSNVSQAYSLTLKGKNGYNNVATCLVSVSAMYETIYSSSTAFMKQEQMKTVIAVNGLSTLVSYNNGFWSGAKTKSASSDQHGYDDLGYGYGGTNYYVYLKNATSSTQTKIRHDCTVQREGKATFPKDYTITSKVLPAITLKSTVSFYGLGTSSSPYQIGIE